MRSFLRSAALALTLLGSAQAATAVTTSDVHLRRTPNGAVLRVIPHQTLLTVSCSADWCRTSYAGRGGYVARRFVRQVTRSAPLAGRGVTLYVTCAQMRAAGTAPIRVGKPGYRTALDRDGDGWACRYDRQR